MDPVTHTLVGAILAETRFGRVPLGTVTLVIGANLPDIDAAAYFLGSDLALGVRRGWTHGVLAMALLPALLGWVMHRVAVARSRRHPATAPPPLGRLMGLSYLAVLSHPALDWLNTYGVRLLMPFDGRWFYGDSVFIIDPWLWLLLGTVVVLAHSSSPWQAAGWIALGAVATLLVTGFPGTPLAMRLLWCLGIAVIAGVRYWGGWQADLPRVAAACCVLAGVYTAAMIGSARLAETQVTAWARDRGLEPHRIMVGPVPANPFRRDVLMEDERHYHRATLDWGAAEPVVPRQSVAKISRRTPIGAQRGEPVGNREPAGSMRPPSDADHEAAAAALTAPGVWGLAIWTRFPAFEVEPLEEGYRVTISDVRFTRRVVELDRNLRPRAMEP